MVSCMRGPEVVFVRVLLSTVGADRFVAVEDVLSKRLFVQRVLSPVYGDLCLVFVSAWGGRATSDGHGLWRCLCCFRAGLCVEVLF